MLFCFCSKSDWLPERSIVLLKMTRWTLLYCSLNSSWRFLWCWPLGQLWSDRCSSATTQVSSMPRKRWAARTHTFVAPSHHTLEDVTRTELQSPLHILNNAGAFYATASLLISSTSQSSLNLWHYQNTPPPTPLFIIMLCCSCPNPVCQWPHMYTKITQMLHV